MEEVLQDRAVRVSEVEPDSSVPFTHPYLLRRACQALGRTITGDSRATSFSLLFPPGWLHQPQGHSRGPACYTSHTICCVALGKALA